MTLYKLSIQFEVDVDATTLQQTAMGVSLASQDGRPGPGPDATMQLANDPRIAFGLVVARDVESRIESLLPGSLVKVTGLTAEQG